jgi:hypothetical protein
VVLLTLAGRSFRSSSDGIPDLFCLLGVQFLLGKAAEDNDADKDKNRDEGDKGGDEKIM